VEKPPFVDHVSNGKAWLFHINAKLYRGDYTPEPIENGGFLPIGPIGLGNINSHRFVSSSWSPGGHSPCSIYSRMI